MNLEVNTDARFLPDEMQPSQAVGYHRVGHGQNHKPLGFRGLYC